MVIGWLALLLLRIAFESPVQTLEGSSSGSRSASTATYRDYGAALGRFLERHSSSTPEWIDMLGAILRNEGFANGKGWWRPSQRLHGWTWLRDRFDLNSDGRLEASEIRAGLRAAGADMDDLDRDLSGDISEVDLEPARGRQLSGVTEAIFRQLDDDSNDRVSWAELSWFFQRADRGKRGSITREDLESILGTALERRTRPEPAPSRDRTLALFFSGNLGSFREGPRLGDMAPDFKLPSQRGNSTFRLSSDRKKRPTVLIFGSFT